MKRESVPLKPTDNRYVMRKVLFGTIRLVLFNVNYGTENNSLIGEYNYNNCNK